MDELLESMVGGDDIGLNITKSIPLPKKIKVKGPPRNKFEKRRAASARAKGKGDEYGGDGGRIGIIEGNLGTSTTTIEPSSSISKSKNDSLESFNQSSSVVDTLAIPNSLPSSSNSPLPPSTQSSGSRKSHTLNLDDNNQRSEYYSTYHARPEEVRGSHGWNEATAKALNCFLT